MLKPKALTEVLSQANTDGVTATLLINREGILLAHSGCCQGEALTIAAIASNIWCCYEKNGADCFHDDKLKWFFIVGERGKIAVCKVATMLLCMRAQLAVESGMLKSKLHVVKEYLETPLASVVQR